MRLRATLFPTSQPPRNMTFPLWALWPTVNIWYLSNNQVVFTIPPKCNKPRHRSKLLLLAWRHRLLTLQFWERGRSEKELFSLLSAIRSANSRILSILLSCLVVGTAPFAFICQITILQWDPQLTPPNSLLFKHCEYCVCAFNPPSLHVGAWANGKSLLCLPVA